MRTVLLTGATGVVGSALGKRLLEDEGTRLRLLLRADSPAHLEARLQELLRFWNIPAKAPALRRVEAVAGDVSRPRMGLDERAYRRLASEVTGVIHSAGNVRLNRTLEAARSAALDPARHVVSFVRTCGQGGGPVKLDFISTVGVAGRTAGTVPECVLEGDRRFRNTYEAAKAEAEAFLLGEMNTGLAATIHRPSMVVGDSTSGTIMQFQVFYFLCEFLSGCRTGGLIPRVPDVQLDIVPVDFVTRAIEVSSRCPDATGRILHLCSGPTDAPPLMRLAARVREIFAAHGRHTPPVRPVPSALFQAVMAAAGWLYPGTGRRRAFRSLPHLLAYLGTPQVFANHRTDEFLRAAGVERPAVDAYLEPVLSYYLSREAWPVAS